MSCIGITIGTRNGNINQNGIKMAWSLCRQKHPYFRAEIKNNGVYQAKQLSYVQFVETEDINSAIDKFTHENMSIDRDPV